MTAPAWTCLGHRTRGALAPICRGCACQADGPLSAPSPAVIVVVDGRPTVICDQFDAQRIPTGEAVELDAEMVEAMDEMSRYRYGGTD